MIFLAAWQLLAVILAGTHLMASPIGILVDIADKWPLYLRALGFTGRRPWPAI